MQFEFKLKITADSYEEARKMAEQYLTAPAVTAITVAKNKKNLLGMINHERKVELTLKVFAPDTEKDKVMLRYTEDETCIELKGIGSRRGEDVTISCDAGSWLSIGTESGPSVITTDDSLDGVTRMNASCAEVYISGKDAKGFVMVDAHKGAAGQRVISLQIASGVMKNATVMAKKLDIMTA